MSDPSTQHSTVVQARTYETPSARVFRAVSDPIERMRVYAAGAGLTVAFEQLDLRVGGRDVFRFGCGHRLRFRGECIYHDIVSERRIVSTDIVSAMSGCGLPPPRWRSFRWGRARSSS